MIIRENGIVVGKLDDKTLRLTESTSARLTGLVENWTKNGIEFMSPSEQPLQNGMASADELVVMPPTNEFFIDAIHNHLLIAGFEVQTA